MNEKGLTITELLIVIVVMGIIAGIATVSASSVISNTKKEAYVATGNNLVIAGKYAYRTGSSLWDDDIATLQELIDEGFFESIDIDPWGGEYDYDNSFVTTSLDDLDSHNLSFLSYQSLNSNSSNFYLSLVSSKANIGEEIPKKDYDKDDVILNDLSDSSIFNRVLESFDKNLNKPIETTSDDDEIIVNGNITTKGRIISGDGNDVISIGNNLNGYAEINSGDGDDILNIAKKLKNNSSINTGRGNDIINIGNDVAANSEIDTDDGDDSISIGGEIKNTSTIFTGDGDDTLNVADDIQNRTSISTGNGNDTIVVKDDFLHSASLDTGTGDDIVSIHDVMNNGTIKTQDGNDTVSIKVIKRKANISSGNGNDVLTITTIYANFNGIIVLGTGNDNLTIHNSSNNVRNFKNAKGNIDGGNGYDVLYLPNISEDEFNSNGKNLFVGFEKIVLEDTTLYY